MALLVVLAGVGIVAASVAKFALARWPSLDPAAPSGAVRAVGEEVEREEIRRDERHGFVQHRLDPQAATGLALTLAVGVALVGGTMLAVLAFVARSNHTTLRIDRGVTNWAGTNATDLSTSVLKMLTQLGSSVGVITISVVLVVVAAVRTRHARKRAALTTAAYLATVVIGQNVISNTLKYVVDRARPTFHPLAGFSGPSFPSGHTTAAFACYCAFAVVLGRGRGRTVQTNLLAVAIGVAAMIGTSRVMLGVHWLTDVIAGAALGLAWFSLVTIAFGGRLLRFGAPVEAGRRAADITDQASVAAADG